MRLFSRMLLFYSFKLIPLEYGRQVKQWIETPQEIYTEDTV